jgi:hypothetical protein
MASIMVESDESCTAQSERTSGFDDGAQYALTDADSLQPSFESETSTLACGPRHELPL